MNWDEYFLRMAETAALKSKDESTKVGAIIVSADHKIVSTGFNDFPRGVQNKPERRERPLKYTFTIHAEQNAVIHSGRDNAIGCSIYVACIPNENGGGVPCAECAKSIINAGIKRIITRKFEWNEKHKKTWWDSIQYSKQMFEEAGVELIYV